MITSHSWVAVASLILLALGSSTARAQALFGITFDGAQTQLISINPTTGAGTVIGPNTPMMPPTGIAFRGNKLYFYGTGNTIRELDQATGSTITTVNIGGSPPFGGEGDVAFRSDGVGFIANNQFWRFDITGPTFANVTATTPFVDGMSFDAADVLFALEQGGGNLVTIDTVTGTKTVVGPTGIVGAYNYGGLAFDTAGTLFAVVSSSTPGPSVLYKINPTTGTATLVGNIGIDSVAGLAIERIIGPPVAGATLTQSGGTTAVTEGGATDTYIVVLNTAPTGNVTLTLNPGTQVTVAPATLTFTPANWNVAQTVTVTAVDDPLVEGAHTGTITHTSASADAAYNGVAIANITANITDNDAAPPPPPPIAGVLYGVTNTNELITINTTTGVGTLVGPLSSAMQATGLGFRGNNLYVWDTVANRLRQLDPSTAATVNTIDIGIVASTGGDMTFRSDGIGFTSTALPVSTFWRFDITVPSATVIVTPIVPNMYGLAFNPAGVLYGLRQNGAELHTINQVSGVTTLVGPTGLPVLASGAIAFDSTGNLFAAMGTAASSLYRIDPITATPTLIGNIGFNQVSGITFAAAAPIPPLRPPGGGGISEGSYSGSKGPGTGFGGEGTFGFGRQASMLHPFLKGPYRDPAGTFRVFNVGHPQRVQTPDADSGLGILGWSLLTLSTLAAAAVVFLRSRLL